MATTASANPSFVPQSPSHWVPDEKRNSCKSCHKEFTFFFRKHHCRSCRDVFCDDCTDFRLLARDPKDPSVVISVRACRPCFDKFRGRKMRGAKANSGQGTASTTTKVTRSSRPAEAEKAHAQPQDPHTKREVEMEPAVEGSEEILNIPSDALASVKNSTVDPQQHAHYEGEDADITGTETIRVEEDDDHQVYPDDGSHAHSEHGHTMKLFTVLGADGKVMDVDRDQVMATQGSVVLPSNTAHGGLQFVNVDNSASASRTSATTATSTTTAPTTTTATTTASLPSDTSAVFEKSTVTARTPSSTAPSSNNSNIVFLPVDKDKLVVDGATPGGGEKEKDEFDRSAVDAVEGSEDEIMNIPSDALASVKNSTLMARQHQGEEGDVAWSDRNVENRFAAASPTNAVPMLFDDTADADGQKKSVNKVV